MFATVQAFFAPGTTARGVALAAATVLCLFILYQITKRPLARYVRRRALKPENAENFLLLYRYVWFAVAFVLVLIALSGSLVSLGLSAAFVGMVLGWSLQAPVTGIAAWLMIILKRPFKIGDRIIVSGITGDVTDINLTHIVLNQVGGTVWGEEKSGRGVLIPNATLFHQVIYNYTLEQEFILDEVPVQITFASDYDEAEKVMIQAAREVIPDIIQKTGQQPYVRAEISDHGIRLRLRYQTLPKDRVRLNTDIIRLVHRRIRDADRVEFCYPHTEIVYRPAESEIRHPSLLK